jgi:hypothetical protein
MADNDRVGSVAAPEAEESRVSRAEQANALMEAEWAALREARAAAQQAPQALQVNDGFEAGAARRPSLPTAPAATPESLGLPADPPPRSVRANVEPPRPNEQRPVHDAQAQHAIGRARLDLNHFIPHNVERSPSRTAATPESARGINGNAGISGTVAHSAEVVRENDQTIYRQTAREGVSGDAGLSVPLPPSRNPNQGMRPPTPNAAPTRVGVSGQYGTNGVTTVEVRIPGAQQPGAPVPAAEAIRDPMRLPDGGSVSVRREVTERQQAGLNVPLVGGQAQAAAQRERTVSSATEIRIQREGNSVVVTRSEENRVRVHSSATGSGGRDIPIPRTGRNANVSGSATGEIANTRTEREERSARFDLSTSEGRAAYERFQQTLDVPPSGTPGVSDVTRRQVTGFSRTHTASGQVTGGAEGRSETASGQVSTEFAREDVTLTRPDGAVERQSTTQREGYPTVRQSSVNGGPPSYTVTLPVSAEGRRQLQQAFGQPVTGSGGQATITMTEQEFQQFTERLRVNELGQRMDGPALGPRHAMEFVSGRDPATVARDLWRALERRRNPSGGQLAIE